ncbi:MFS transporter [Candidatus Woesearchaeota archaeon]|nr:MFS transporter [Candidatus Woesearchaeota archaeon]
MQAENSKNDESKVKKSLKASIFDGASFAVMDGMTASYMTPFAIALNSSVNVIAALTYAPQLVGAFVILFTSKIVELMKDRKKIIFLTAIFHAILWIPLLLIPYLSPAHQYLLIVYISIQTVFAEIMSPVWNSLMGDIVPPFERGRFFALRNRIVGITSFVSALSAGLLLSYLSPKHPFLGFTILFAIAFIARLMSAVFRGMMHNPHVDYKATEKFSLVDFVKKMDKTNYGRFVAYIALFKFSVSVASPFFVLYMLRDLKFSYLQFTILTAAEIIASFIAAGMWGRLIDKKGTKFVLYVTGIMTPLIPLFWLFSGNFHYLMLVEMYSGFSWAGFNLSASNFMFDTVRPQNRVRCISYFRFFESIAIFFGALLGGFLIHWLPSWVFLSSIPLLFLISGVLRLLSSLLMLPSLKEVRFIEMEIGHSFFKKYITIRPTEGLVFEVIGKYHAVQDTTLKHAKKFIGRAKKGLEIGGEEAKAYKKKLMDFIDKGMPHGIEKKRESEMEKIGHITEEIEMGKLKGK